MDKLFVSHSSRLIRFVAARHYHHRSAASCYAPLYLTELLRNVKMSPSSDKTLLILAAAIVYTSKQLLLLHGLLLWFFQCSLENMLHLLLLVMESG